MSLHAARLRSGLAHLAAASARPTTRQVAIVAGWAGALIAVKLLLMLLAANGTYEFSTPVPAILLGIFIGLTYGLLAVGLVLIYRTNRIINFAHGQFGAFAAALFGLAAVSWHVPYWVAFPLALLLAAGTGALAETAVVRRLRNAPRLMSVVATLGVGQFLLIFGFVLNAQVAAGSTFPMPPAMPTFRVGSLLVTQAYSGMLILSPVVVVAIALFLRVSKYGLAMRAAAANPEAARMAGISANRMSSLAWAIAGVLSAFTAILAQPTRGFGGGEESFGPFLLLLAMAGAVLARMNNLPQAMMAGIGLGVVQQLLLWNHPRSGFVELALFVIILGSLLLQKRRGGRDDEKGSWAAVQALRPVPEALRQLPMVRHLGLLAFLVLLALLVALPSFISNSAAVTVTSMMGFAIVGLSIVILSGLGGQLTLGQFAVGAMGAVVSFYVSSRTGNFPMAILYGGAAAALVSALLGLPALRIRGLMLTVTTLAFALVTPTFLLGILLGDGQDPGRPILPGGQALDTGKAYYWFALALFLVALWLARNIHRSGFGRLLVAVRDNEDNARAFTVRASVVKPQGYLVAGFLAGVGGAAYGHGLSNIGAPTFPAQASIDVVVMTVIGGVSVLAGPILGVLLVIGVPAFVPLGSLALAGTRLGLLLLILYLPGGLAQVIGTVRDRLIRRIATRHGVDYDAVYEAADPEPANDATGMTTPVLSGRHARIPDSPEQVTTARTRGVLLQARDLRKHFGGVHAVDGVTLHVNAGETVGLIGPNGAGKTTTFELLGGFTRADTGQVRFGQRDITSLGPEARGRLGLIRSFQDAALFPTMTVTQSIMLALERVQPTSVLSSLVGWTAEEHRKEQQARALVAWMGLDRYRDKQIRELSTGTRRICEIACLVALRPTLLLLDEPSSGIAQRESEALGSLLADLKHQLQVTLVVIEHDIPLIMGISDRIIAMADGRIISEGTPEQVQADPLVIESYLGGSIEAIQRSGTRGDAPALAGAST